MSVYKDPRSPYWQFYFRWRGHRFFGRTKTHDQARSRKGRGRRAREGKGARRQCRWRQERRCGSTTWRAVSGMRRASITPAAATRAGDRLSDRDFGKDKLLTDITDDDVVKLVAWRRGHRTRGGALIAPGTVNLTIVALKSLFARASLGRPRAREPEWRRHWLAGAAGAPARTGRRRSRAARSGDAGRLRAAVRLRHGHRAAAMPSACCAGHEVDLRRTADQEGRARAASRSRSRSRRRSAKSSGRLRGHHPEHVFTYVAVRTHRGWVKGRALSSHAGGATGALAPAAQGAPE